MEENINKLEALLFFHGEPIAFKKIEKILDLKVGEGELVAKELQKKRDEFGGGLMVMIHDGRVQLATRKELASLGKQFVKDELDSDLTPASLETLSLVLYFGPVSRTKLEYIRGVNSIFTLRNLMIRGLVERKPDPSHPNSFLYQPSFASLKHLGIERQEDLPDYDKFKTLLEKTESNSEIQS